MHKNPIKTKNVKKLMMFIIFKIKFWQIKPAHKKLCVQDSNFKNDF